MTADPDECVRIVEELAAHIRPNDTGGKTLAASLPILDRILAAVKPKAKWPPRIEGQIIYGQRDATTLDGQFDAVEMNTIAVAWFEEQGVDLRQIVGIVGCSGVSNQEEVYDNLAAILDNAEAD